MTDISSPVRDFSIAFFMPGLLPTVFFCLALALTLAAATWLGLRHALRQHGTLVQGTVTQSLLRTGRTRTSEFSTSERTTSRSLTIVFRDGGGAEHTLSGFHYSIGSDDADAPRVGSQVPVYYLPAHPGIAVYYNPRWHYPVPLLALALLLPLLWMTANFCYRDIRVQNSLAVAGWTEEQFRQYQDAIIEASSTLYQNPDNAEALHRRGDAQFATVQFGDAIADYRAALRLHPEDKAVRRKLAKAEWLEGQDYEALRDWLGSR